MSARVEQNSGAARQAEGQLARANDDLRLELAQGALDAAGIVDPTPISDVAGAGLSLYRGDFIGAGLSLVSVVPYLGDAIGKTAKGARAVKRLNRLREGVTQGVERLAKARASLRQGAAAEIRAERANEAAQQLRKYADCATCPKPSNRFGVSKLPATGEWKDGAKLGERGNSSWFPDAATPDGKAVLEATGGRPVRFADGYPDFSPHTYQLPNGQPARVQIDMKGTGVDFTAANNQMKQIDPNWRQPKDYTWHHHHDGTTMELVPTNLNAKAPHDGGASIARDPGY